MYVYMCASCILHVFYMYFSCIFDKTCIFHVFRMYFSCILYVFFMYFDKTCISHVFHMYFSCNLYVFFMYFSCITISILKPYVFKGQTLLYKFLLKNSNNYGQLEYGLAKLSIELDLLTVSGMVKVSNK